MQVSLTNNLPLKGEGLLIYKVYNFWQNKFMENDLKKILSNKELTRELLISVKPYAFKLTKNISDRDDLLQMCFLKVIQKQDQFKGGSVQSWLYRIIYTTFLDEFVNRRREELHGEDLAEVSVPGDQISSIEDAEALTRLDHCMERLTNKERHVTQFKITNLKVNQIAEIMDETRVNIRQISARARIKLNDCMGTNQ